MSWTGLFWRINVAVIFGAWVTALRGASPADWPGQFFTLASLSTNGQVISTPTVVGFAGPAHWVVEGRNRGQLGWAVAAGTFNGQGRPELAVVEPAINLFLTNITNSGRIIGFSFPKAGVLPRQEWTRVGHSRGIDFRGDISAGDMTGEGWTDLVVGMADARTNRFVMERQGLVQLLPGQREGGLASGLHYRTGAHLASLGKKVLLADVDRDGRAEVLLASSNHAGKTNAAGGVEMISSTNIGSTFSNTWRVAGRDDKQYLGSALAVGDINGDGWPDLLAGATGELREGRRMGGVHWFAGSSKGFPPVATQVIYGPQADTQFGHALAVLGDLDGDGCAELVVGAPGSLVVSNWAGAAYIFRGARTGLVAQAIWSAQGWGKRAAFGQAVALAGDVNADGRPDLLIGAPGSVEGQITRPGIASLWLGRAEGFATNADWRVTEMESGGLLGIRVGCAGDLDGDGVDDFYVASPYHHEKRRDNWRGRVDVFRGLRRGYGAEEQFPADGTFCRAGDHTPQTQGRIRLDELTSKADQTTSALVRASNAQWRAKEAAHEKTLAEHQAQAAARREDAARQMARRRLWWGTGTGVLLSGALAGLWFNRRRTRAHAVRMERERIARDLHDGLGSGVHRLQRLTELLNQVGAGSPEAQRYRDELLLTAQELGGSMDRTIWAVQPENDTLENLVSYLANYAPSVLRANGIECELDLPATLPAHALHGDMRQHLFLAVNEALNNVVKHSRARRAWLRVAWNEPWLEIGIEDDGCGWGESSQRDAGGTLRSGGGNGLKNLVARLVAMQGRVDLLPRAGGGTRVVLRAPL